MASVFRPSEKGRRMYRIDFVDHHGQRKVVSSGMTDRRAAEGLASLIERDVDRLRAGLQPENLKLTAPHLGLERAAEVSWDQGVTEYLAELVRQGSTPTSDHYKDSRTLLARIQRECGWKTVHMIRPSAFTAFLGRLGEQDRAPRTQNRYHETLRAACNFWKRQGYLTENPLVNVRPVKVGQKGRRRLRRPFTRQELDRLCAAVHWQEHAIAYQVAAYSGFRWGELRRLTKEDCNPIGPRPRWHVDPSRTKNGQPVRLPMTPECAQALADTWQSLPPGHKLLRVPRKDRFKKHRAKAGIPAQDERGRWADFHSLRYTFCLWMSRLFPIEVVSKLMRHSSLNLTAQIYLDLGLDREGEGEWVLPSLFHTAGHTAAQAQPANAKETVNDKPIAQQ